MKNKIQETEDKLFLDKLRKLCIEYDIIYPLDFDGLSVYSFCERKLLGTNGLQKSWILQNKLTVSELLAKLKEKRPELRYGQILSNAVLKHSKTYLNPDIYYIDDTELQKVLELELFGEQNNNSQL